jgi:hypothetical protein
MRRVLVCGLVGFVCLLWAGFCGAEEGHAGALLFPNSDFEMGNLTNWRTEGDAFKYQPVKGDNVKARSPKQSAKHAGAYWVGTYEKYQGKTGEKAGATQGNAPVGGLLSQRFIIEQPSIGFLIGGGGKGKGRVQLVVEGSVVREAEGKDSPEMERMVWDVTDYQGKSAMVYITDSGKGSYGIVCADDFRYWERGERLLLFPNSDFEGGTLAGWVAEGAAFERQPVKGDNVAMRTGGERRAGHQGDWWIGTFERYQGKAGEKPGAFQDNAPTGTLKSEPFTITGDRIVFRMGGGNRPEIGVRLVVDGKLAFVAHGRQTPTMSTVMWDVSPYKGETAQIEIFDQSSASWGFVCADDFHYVMVEGEAPQAAMVPAAAGEAAKP